MTWSAEFSEDPLWKAGGQEGKDGKNVDKDYNEARRYRSMVARINYLSQDRPDIRNASKVLARGMAGPTRNDWNILKHLVGYLAGRRDMKQVFEWQCKANMITAFSGSDWAGDPRDRRSTSGGVIMIGTHCLKHWSRVQSTVAMSSAEAELYAGVRAATELLGVQAMARDAGMDLPGEVAMGATAAIAIMCKNGMTKVRHVEVKWFWVQEAIRNKRFSVKKVSTNDNVADAMTKRLEAKKADDLMARMGARIVQRTFV